MILLRSDGSYAGTQNPSNGMQHIPFYGESSSLSWPTLTRPITSPDEAEHILGKWNAERFSIPYPKVYEVLGRSAWIRERDLPDWWRGKKQRGVATVTASETSETEIFVQEKRRETRLLLVIFKQIVMQISKHQ
ncbi:hypothetical protein TNCV_1653191 [Trichonephila clavipes]|nr:hypothetical protein TNCV_1653191 [Trichonephila clavipes]